METALLEEIERILLSAAFGAIIGLEREWRGKAAGFRTLMLVCMGSTLFTIISYKLPGALENWSGDRIASNIVTGIGFIGAGLIFKSEKNVHGLTTAATVWAAAAVGMAVGAGSYWLAAVSTAAIWITLVLLRYFELAFEAKMETREYRIKHYCRKAEDLLHHTDFFNKDDFKLITKKSERFGDDVMHTWILRASKSKHEAAVSMLLLDPRITELDY